MKKSLRAVLSSLVATLILSPLIAAAADGGTGTPPPQLIALLSDHLGGPVGDAGFGTSKQTPPVTKLVVHVKLPKAPPNVTKLDVIVGKGKVGSITLKPGPNGGVGGELALDSSKGDKIPPVVDGTPITIQAGGDAPFAKGMFRKPPKK